MHAAVEAVHTRVRTRHARLPREWRMRGSACMRARVAAEPRSVEPGGDHSKTTHTAREFHQISKFQGNFIKYIVIVSVIFMVISGVLSVFRPVQ